MVDEIPCRLQARITASDRPCTCTYGITTVVLLFSASCVANFRAIFMLDRFHRSFDLFDAPVCVFVVDFRLRCKLVAQTCDFNVGACGKKHPQKFSIVCA